MLGPYLRDHDPLRMVVLNACRSARTDAVDPFGGMAQGLVQQDATAVVAMQFPISDRAAVTFTGEFYGALVDGLPVDQAVQQRPQGAAGGVPGRVGDARCCSCARPTATSSRTCTPMPGVVPVGSPTRYGPDPAARAVVLEVRRALVGSHRKLVLGAAAGVVAALVVALLVVAQLVTTT